MSQCPLGSELVYLPASTICMAKCFTTKMPVFPRVLLTKIKPTYLQLCDQNPFREMPSREDSGDANEGIQRMSVERSSKEIFVELQTFSLGSYYGCNNL
ncbi:hypothetical protein TNCV_3617751 [Trichonephila clavipes]|nr:hypothetical protein TNCV_3617751 [Trichonephila clavipes]